MWNLRHIYRKPRGFTLIEVLLALTLSTLIFIPLYNILSFSIHAWNIGNEKDELMLNGRYAMEYIKKEIKLADSILPSDRIIGLNHHYKTNIGFVIMKKEDEFYNRYTTYYTKDHKLIRISGLVSYHYNPAYNHLKGFNEVCEYMDSVEETILDKNNKLITLDLKLKTESGESLNLKTDIYIRCPLEY